MKLPSISVRSIMTGLIVVALDCLVFRSISTRPEGLSEDLFRLALATMAMANILAIVIARMAAGQNQARWFWAGFSVGGLVALAATILGFQPTLLWLGKILESTAFGRWISATQIGQVVAYFTLVFVIPLLFQLLGAVVLGLLCRKLGDRSVPVNNAELTPKRHPLRGLVALLILASLPAVAFEIRLRQNLDPQIVRRPIGQVAQVDFQEPNGLGFIIPKGSPMRQLDGIKVQIDSDRNACEPELVETPSGTFINDRRILQVTLLDGNRAGESIGLPYCFLRPIR